MAVFVTSASRSRLPMVRRLAAAITRHANGARLHALVVDSLDATEIDPAFEILSVEDLFESRGPVVLDPSRYAEMAMLYTERELTAALKPWLLAHFLASDDTVVFLAPEIELLGPPDVITEAADGHVVLVPRVRAPIPFDGLQPTSTDVLARGAFDAASLAVGPGGFDFCAWWAERLARDCFDHPANQRYLDQRWLDLVPGLFPHTVVDDPGAGVAYWNLHGRTVARVHGRWTIDGAALHWIHFADFEPRQPDLLAPQLEQPRVTMARLPDLRALCHERAAACSGATDPAIEYEYDRTPAGVPIDERMRHLYRGAVDEARRGLAAMPPNPFLDGSDAFVTWCNTPIAPMVEPVVSRYLNLLRYESDSLSETYPDLAGESGVAYLEHVARHLADAIPEPLRPRRAEIDALRVAQRRTRSTAPPPGVNVLGYLDSVLGLGEVGRALVEALERARVPTSRVSVGGIHSRPVDTPISDGADRSRRFDVNLVCMNPHHFPNAADEVGPSFFAGRRTIGLWFWEVDVPPEGLSQATELVDEIWVASEYVRDVLEPAVDVPITVVPIPVPGPVTEPAPVRSVLGVPDDRFLFLFTFDFLSTMERKNPLGLIAAFRDAFEPDDGALLLLKSINGDLRGRELDLVRSAAAGRDDIIVLDEYLPTHEHRSLMSICDAYVSLHRAEGFGLTMAEAMAEGKPVIATRFSGNLQFMDDATAFLVDARTSLVGEDAPPYPPHAHWADPDLEHASALMREVFENRDEATARGRRAAEKIATQYSVDVVAPRLATLVEQARVRPDSRGVPSPWRRRFTRGWRARLAEGHRYYPYDWLPDGTPVDISMHRAFHFWLQAARLGVRPAPPNPDVPGGCAATLAWLNEPVVPVDRPAVSRYLLQYWRDRPELQERFPDLDVGFDAALFGEYWPEPPDADPRVPGDPEPYLDWVREHWRDETDIPYVLVPPPEWTAPAPSPSEHPLRGAARRLLRRSRN